MPCDIQCPLNCKACEECTNNEPAGDGPDPEMFNTGILRAGTFGT